MKICFLVSFFLFFTQLNSFGNQFITTSKLNVREGASVKNKKIKTIDLGDTITVDSFGVEWSKVFLNDFKKGYVYSKYIKKVNYEDFSNTEEYHTNSKDSSTGSILYLIVFCILLIAYIIAFQKSANKSIIVISGWNDLFLLTVPVIGFIIFMFFGAAHDKLADAINTPNFIVYCIISSFALISSFFLSYIDNKGNNFNILISILAKLFIIFIVVLLIFPLIWGPNTKKDGRFKDGTKDNKRTQWKIMIASFVSFTILRLVRNKDENSFVRFFKRRFYRY